jgi:D-aminopeptidase
MTDRARLSDLGVSIGRYKPGKHNAISDVKGVRVGHSTLIDDSKGRAVRTGVTAILPKEGNIFMDRIFGSGFVLNGAGEVSGLTQLHEWGLLETPILLTNTLSVGAVSEATARFMIERYPGIGTRHDVIIPVVGECDDSWLNDIAGQHIGREHVFAALESATDGPVAEGNVGGGTGMQTCDFKGGIGTSSRRVKGDGSWYTLGVLVMSNFGVMDDLRIDGVPIGRLLAPDYADMEMRRHSYGSIIVVVATDAPLLPLQLSRLAKRAALGVGRAGSTAAHGSGEIVVAFSTANTVPRNPANRKMEAKVHFIVDTHIDPLYEAAVEATEEAIANAMCAAEPMTGASGHYSPALPLERVEALLARYRP